MSSPPVEHFALLQEMLSAFQSFQPDLPLDQRISGLLADYTAKYPAFAPLLSTIELLEWTPSYAILVDRTHNVMFTVAQNPLKGLGTGEIRQAGMTKELFTIRQKYLEWKEKLGQEVKVVASGQGLGGAVVSALSDLEKDLQAHAFQPSGPGVKDPEKRLQILEAAGLPDTPPELTVYQSSDSSSTYVPARVESVVMVAAPQPADSLKELLGPAEMEPDVPKQLYTMVDCPDIKSISIDAETGLIRLESLEGPLAFDPQFTAADIATVFYFVYTSPDMCVFSLDPADPRNPDGKYLRKVYYPAELEGTVLGEVLWRADWKLKQLDQGAWFDEETNERQLISDFQSGLDFAKTDKPGGVAYWRMWFVIDKVSFEKAVSRTGVTLECREVKIRVEARTLTPDPTKRSGFSDLPTPASAGCSKFSKYLTENFDELCLKVPEIKRLRQLAIIKGFAEWVRDMLQVPKELLNLDRLHSMMPKVPTDYPIDKVPKLTNTVSEPYQGMVKRFVVSGGVEITKAELEEVEVEVQGECRKRLDAVGVYGASHEELMGWLLEPETAPGSEDEGESVGFMQLFQPRKCQVEDCAVVVAMHVPQTGSSLPFASKAPVTPYAFEGKVYCPLHHPRRCNAPVCGLACTIILPNQRFLEVGGFRFHEQCFKCYICGEPFADGKCARDGVGFCHRVCAEKKATPPVEEEKKEPVAAKKAGDNKPGKAGAKPGKAAGKQGKAGDKKAGKK